jgi:hypothetical protein
MSLRRIAVIPIVAILLSARLACAYEHPLDAHSVSEAYSLGRRNDETMDKFVAQYFKRLLPPKSGPFISDIEVQTPYVQVVWRAHDESMTYSERQAEKDYADTSDLFLVRARINFTPTYPAFFADNSQQGRYVRRPEDFWNDFKIHLLQGSEIIAKNAGFVPIYLNSGEGARVWIGGDVTWEFDGSQLRSDLIRIQVLTPDGQTVEVKFDLGALR